MDVIRCDASHDGRWNAFVDTHSEASFYHRAEWRDINRRCFGHVTCHLAALEGDRFVGVFPLVQLKSLLFGNIACSLPFVNFGGPSAENADAAAALLAAAEIVADEWDVKYLEVRSRQRLDDRYPTSQHKVSMTVELDADPDKLWSAFKTGQRQDIRRGYKSGFSVRFGGDELLDDFYLVLSESWRDLGTPIYSKQYLQQISATFPVASRVCVVYDSGNVPAAGAFCGEHRDTVEGMWLGTRAAYRRQHVGYVLYWELLKDACTRGFKNFHLGRSSAESGGEQFKKKWNATLTQLHWHYVLRGTRDIPQLNVSNAKYQLAIAAWRKLPLGVTQQLGPMIARSIP